MKNNKKEERYPTENISYLRNRVLRVSYNNDSYNDACTSRLV